MDVEFRRVGLCESPDTRNMQKSHIRLGLGGIALK